MKTGVKILIVVAVIAVILIATFGGTYNSLVQERETVEQSLSTIDVQLKRRADLIPNLVSTVKGYAEHESEVLDSVTQARTQYASASSVAEKAAADSEMSGALSRLLMVVENYPDLKADANFRQLSDELAGTENRIGVARQDYNEAARTYNTKIKSFPTNIVAPIMGFAEVEYFEASESDRDVPEVSF
ncbi:MAG: LemA family protein [Clostridia bacterium]|nr:LemA family protein [Clostridia bacterium]